MMRIGRTLPPAAAPIYLRDIFSGIKGLVNSKKAVLKITSELKDHFQSSHCFMLSSGKAALTLTLKAVSAMAGNEQIEVVIPAFTCYSVPAAVIKAGLKVRVCDIDPHTLDFDFEHLEQILSENKGRILAVLSTHMFGYPSDVDRIRGLMKSKPRIYLIEDAAQAMGASINSRKCGTLGDVGFFSLGRGKSISCVEGGIILTRDPQIAKAIDTEYHHLSEPEAAETVKLMIYSAILWIFMRPLFFWFPKSLPFLKLGETVFDPDFEIRKICGFQAGLLTNWKNKLLQVSQDRKKNVMLWQRFFEKYHPDNLSWINGNEDLLIRFPVWVKDDGKREQLLLAGETQGLGISRSYPDSINHIPELEKLIDFPECVKASETAYQLVTLPVHSFVLQKERHKIQELLLN